MKIKEKTRTYDAKYGCFRGVKCWRVVGHCDNRTEYHLMPLDTQGEADEWAEILRKSMVLDADGLKEFYGCVHCLDARNNHYERLGHGDQARYCIHKECPYADEIERAGGYEKLYDDFCNNNYSFIDFSKATAFYEEVENGKR